MENKVSIIIPFYNTNIFYYKKCQDSICNQSYHNIEVIVIDDGSCDEAAQKLNEISKLDTRVHVIHKANGGVSSARNVGLRMATGKYISFIDSDDWVEPMFIETLVDCIEKNDAQISVVNVCNDYNVSEIKVQESNSEVRLLQGQEIYEALLESSANVYGYLWNKLYIRELITQFFNEGYHYCEDLVFNAQYVKNVQVCAVSSVKLYHYCLGRNNVTENFSFNSKILTLIDAYQEIETIFTQECPQKIAFIKLSILKQALNIRARYKVCKINNINQYNHLQKIIHEYWKASKSVSILEKLNIRLTYVFPVFLFKIKRFILNSKKR